MLNHKHRQKFDKINDSYMIEKENESYSLLSNFSIQTPISTSGKSSKIIPNRSTKLKPIENSDSKLIKVSLINNILPKS